MGKWLVTFAVIALTLFPAKNLANADLKPYVKIKVSDFSELHSDINATADSFQELHDYLTQFQPLAEQTDLDVPLVIHILKQAKINGIRPGIFLGLIELESSFNILATNHNTNGTIDRGLTQINSDTAPWLWLQVYTEEYSEEKLFNPYLNVELGAKFLGDLLREYGSYSHALTAFNRGPTGLQNHISETATAESNYSRMVLNRSRKYSNWQGVD